MNPLEHDAAVTAEAMAAEAKASRRADRARQMMHAAEIILLGHDDTESLTVAGWDLARFKTAPGLRTLSGGST